MHPGQLTRKTRFAFVYRWLIGAHRGLGTVRNRPLNQKRLLISSKLGPKESKVERGSTSGMGHLGIRIINIVLFTASCFFAESIVNHVADSQLAPDYVSAFQPVARSEPETPKRQERNAILERNLFGAKLEGSGDSGPPPPPVEVVQEAEATKLPIELLGTMAGEPSSLSSAVINNTRTKKHQVVRLGDVLDDFTYVKVTDIEPGRVLLRNREIIEELLLDKNAGSTKSKAASSARSGSDALQRLRERKSRRNRKAQRDASTRKPPLASPRTTTSADDEEEERLQKIQNAMSKDLIRDLEPAMNDEGGIEGVLVGDIDADSLLARAGLAPDDVITSLNGINIDSAGAAARVLRELAKCVPVTFTANGAGGTRTMEIPQSLLSELNCTN